MVTFTSLSRLRRPFDLQLASALAPILPFFLHVEALAPLNISLNSIMYLVVFFAKQDIYVGSLPLHDHTEQNPLGIIGIST